MTLPLSIHKEHEIEVHQSNRAVAIQLQMSVGRIEAGVLVRNGLCRICVASAMNLHRIGRFRFDMSVSIIGKHDRPEAGTDLTVENRREEELLRGKR